MNHIFLYIVSYVSATALVSLLIVNILLSLLVAIFSGPVKATNFWVSFVIGLLFTAFAALIMTLASKTKKSKYNEIDIADKFPDSGQISYYIRRLKMLKKSGVISNQEYNDEIDRLMNQ